MRAINQKIKIFHIHCDSKFVCDINAMYKNVHFENHLVYVGKRFENIDSTDFRSVNFEAKFDNIDNIVNYLNSADIIVVNYLDEYKSQIVNRIPKNIKIIWRFFGVELYYRKENKFLSKETKFLQKDKFNFIKYIKTVKNKIYNKNDVIFFKAVERIDYITSFCKEEYEFLEKHWKIPKFLQLSLEFDMFQNKKISYIKCPIIILGNNRHNFNNHSNLIDIANNSTNTQVEFLMFFNYGGDGLYQEKIREMSLKNSKIKLIEHFLQIEDFDDIYKNAAAFAHNGFRQMALGNIFTAISYGLKIYLNDTSVIYRWLRNEGLSISPIQNLQNDLDNNKYELSKEEIDSNIKKYNQLADCYNVNHFQKNLLKILND